MEEILKIKEAQTMQKLCYSESNCLRKFTYEVFSLEYEENPKYEKLKDLLLEAFNSENENKGNIQNLPEHEHSLM